MKNNFMTSIVRAVVTLPLADNFRYLFTQISYLVKTKSAQVYQPAGLAHVPMKGAQVIVLNINDKEDDSVSFPFETSRRFKNLLPGETAVYNSETQDFIIFKNDKSIFMKSSKVIVDSSDTNFTGSVKVGGSMEIEGSINAKGIVKSDIDCLSGVVSGAAHIHGGVTGGNGTTGGPQ